MGDWGSLEHKMGRLSGVTLDKTSD